MKDRSFSRALKQSSFKTCARKLFLPVKKPLPRTSMDMVAAIELLLRLFCAVLRSSLFSIFDRRAIQTASNNMVSNAWQVLYASTANENNAVLLEIMSFTTDVGNDLLSCRQPDPSDFSQSRVWFFRCFRFHLKTHTAL